MRDKSKSLRIVQPQIDEMTNGVSLKTETPSEELFLKDEKKKKKKKKKKLVE